MVDESDDPAENEAYEEMIALAGHLRGEKGLSGGGVETRQGSPDAPKRYVIVMRWYRGFTPANIGEWNGYPVEHRNDGVLLCTAELRTDVSRQWQEDFFEEAEARHPGING